MTRLSVNINKVATLRNARGGNVPDVVLAATEAERFGADGITVHPRPDQRHIRYDDVPAIRRVVRTELNIEGYPSEPFLALVGQVLPHQVTLVPDPPDALTSNAGWDVAAHVDMLRPVVTRLREKGMRVSLFMEADPAAIRMVPSTGADCVELYTESYAAGYAASPEEAVGPFVAAAEAARASGLAVHAGHDLSLQNLAFLVSRIPFLAEVSIGHALISDALYLGLENAVGLYKRQVALGLKKAGTGI